MLQSGHVAEPATGLLSLRVKVRARGVGYFVCQPPLGTKQRHELPCTILCDIKRSASVGRFEVAQLRLQLFGRYQSAKAH